MPLDCVDPITQEPLGSRDFVLGFTTVFSYEGVQNQNPHLLGAEFGRTVLGPPEDPASVQTPCMTEEDCARHSEASGQPLACSDTGLCSPTAIRCVKGACPTYRLWPRVDASSAELIADGSHEIMWANFYATSGEIGSETRLVSDRNRGLLEGYATHWQPPETSGRALLITLNDQRGGAAWTSFDVVVR